MSVLAPWHSQSPEHEAVPMLAPWHPMMCWAHPSQHSHAGRCSALAQACRTCPQMPSPMPSQQPTSLQQHREELPVLSTDCTAMDSAAPQMNKPGCPH